MSVTRSVIAAISKEACSSLLLRRGFHRAAPHFWRAEEGINHAVNFQASAWGSKEAGRFTVNLGVSTHALYEGFTGRRFPANPGTALWPINVRLGELMTPGVDRWWDVTVESNVQSIGEEVSAALREYGLPFFERLRNRNQVIEWARSAAPGYGVFRAQIPLILAVMAAERGDASEARTLLRAAISDSRGHSFETTIRRVAKNIGVAVDDL